MKYIIGSAVVGRGETDAQFSPNGIMKIAARYGATLAGSTDTEILVEMAEEDAQRLHEDHPGFLVEANSEHRLFG